MLRLKAINTAPPGGFSFQDAQTGWRTHAWSFRMAWGAWYRENDNRRTGRTMEQCASDVEQYVIKELMKQPNWDLWVMDDTPQFKFPDVIPMGPVESNISVVIPIYEPSERLARCVEAVKQHVSEVVIVMDVLSLPPKFDPAVVQEDPKIKYVYENEKDLGFGAKCNLGAKHAKSQYLWFLNDDCYPKDGCAERLMDVLTADPRIGMVGHLLRYPDGRIQHGGCTRAVPPGVGFPHVDVGAEQPSIKGPCEMEAVTAASILVRREAFEAVGGFDEQYFLYLEDSDLCLKMRTAGWKVYYTPHAVAVHEEHASSKLRPDLAKHVAHSVELFSNRWMNYFATIPQAPKFEDFHDTAKVVDLEAVYVTLAGNPDHENNARRFVESALRFKPGKPVRWVVCVNSNGNGGLSKPMKELFRQLGDVSYFAHDNSGWDLGAYQAYCRVSKAAFTLFFGSSAYFRRENWMVPVTAAIAAYGDKAIYGTCGNLGDPNVAVSPHLRTTGFWCSPQVFNKYPMVVTKPEQRYPFEHGPSCFTLWAWSQGLKVLVVDADGVYSYPAWNDGPNGYHRGNQSSLLFGDRLTGPPYFAYA